MTNAATLPVFISILLASGPAMAAGNHHICYQDKWQGQDVVVVQCRSDTPAVTCTMHLPTAMPTTPPVGSGGNAAAFIVSPGHQYDAQINFSDGTNRLCSTRTTGFNSLRGYAFVAQSNAVPDLVGYTTDASGLVTTGIWHNRTQSSASKVQNTVFVPGDFSVVGGGGLGAEVPNGSLLSILAPAGDVDGRGWLVQTEDAVILDPQDNENFAIGMKIQGLTVAQLRTLLSWSNRGLSGPTGSVSAPVMSVAAAPDFVVLGGGAAARDLPDLAPFGQYLTTTAPNPDPVIFCLPGVSPPGCKPRSYPIGWLSASKDHGVARPGILSPSMSTMPRTFTMTTTGKSYSVDVWLSDSTSAVAAHPATTVAGLSGEYALTGVGATVNWQRTGAFGNLLWKVVPRADIAGVDVASKDHAFSSRATITGYAIGIKLVPVP